MHIVDHIAHIIEPHLLGKHKKAKALELSIKILEVLRLNPDTPHELHTNQD